MLHRCTCFARVGYILLVIALFAAHVPSAIAFTNGQAASRVLGQPDFITSPQLLSASGVHTPHSVAVDSAGRLWVADTFHHRVLRFDHAAGKANGAAADGVLGQPDFTSSTPDITASGMNNPRGVAVDSAGRLWVVDQLNSRVLRFDDAAGKANGAAADGVLGQIDLTSRVFATTQSGMSAPSGVAVDSAGRLWIADLGNSRVLRFDDAAGKANGAAADGVLGQPDFTSNTIAITASGMWAPIGVAVGSTGCLWVVDNSTHRVLRFDGAAGKPNGAAADGVLGQLDFTSSVAAVTASGLNGPYGAAADSSDRLWVVDYLNNRVLRFDGTSADVVLGQPDFTSGLFAVTASGMLFPHGVAVDNTGYLWVADGGRVLRFDDTTLTLTWTTPAAITYGTALSVAQLNASANVPGTFSYTPPLGTVLNVGAGQTLSVLFTPTDLLNYPTATATVTIDVTQVPQTITFDALVDKTLGDLAFGVSAAASSGLPVSFSSSTPTICTVSGSMVALLAVGTCMIAANQAGDMIYSAASPVARSFRVTGITDPRLLYISLVRR